MSDSLRDQLKQAGFAEKKPKARNNKASSTASAAAQTSKRKAQAVANRIAQKTAITELINEHQLKKFAGESVYSYSLEKKIRQLFVTNDARTKLINGECVITRLNGATYLVPEVIGKAILTINPQWLVVSAKDDNNDSDEYNDFPVPDDLQW